MGQTEQAFVYYFKENMKHTPLIPSKAIPETIFGSFSAATGSITTMAGYIAKHGKAARVEDMILTIPMVARYVAGAGGLAATLSAGAPFYLELAVTVGGLAAAYYLGAFIGSTMVAAFKVREPISKAFSATIGNVQYPPPTYNARFPNSPKNYISISEAATFLRAGCNKTRMPHDVQIVYHKFPELLRCH